MKVERNINITQTKFIRFGNIGSVRYKRIKNQSERSINIITKVFVVAAVVIVVIVVASIIRKRK